MSKTYKANLRILMILLLDLFLVAFCCAMAFMVRYEFSFDAMPDEQKTLMWRFIALQGVITIVVFLVRKMYNYIWRTVSAYDVGNMFMSVVLAFALSYVAGRLLGMRIPNSVAFIEMCLLLFTQVGMRCVLRFYRIILQAVFGTEHGRERIMLIGAGEAGRLLLHEIGVGKQPLGKVCCIIDDNPTKWGKHMDGVPIVGGREKIQEQAAQREITQIIFAIPTAEVATRRDILDLCKTTGCQVKTLPGVYQLVNGEVSLADIKDVQLEDLLGREPVQLDTQAIRRFLRDRVVIITGGGGSIGSELCRQVAQYEPKQLIVLDIYENNAYDIQQELLHNFPGLDLRVEIASVRDKEKVYELFDRYRPDVVFHAAAHKHVPLMENNPEEAVKNNIFGTYHVVRAAEKFDVKKFVMISSDKAVNPTNVMGATKRFCEMILQSRTGSNTEFCAVRFGNVLGSNGSVVPLFKKQIEAGGPVTLTDRRVIRYFMTIPEASQLVLEAGAMAKRGQIFVLDMGEPVKILTLAENLIRLSGLVPYEDIEIEEIGLRPGEKLYEELLMDSNQLKKTANEKIFIDNQDELDQAVIMTALTRLDEAVSGDASREGLVALMKELVATYHSPEEINCHVGKHEEV